MLPPDLYIGHLSNFPWKCGSILRNIWSVNPFCRCGNYSPERLLYFPVNEVAQSCLTLCDPMDCSLPGSSVHGIFPGKNTGVGCHYLLQEIFPTKGLNPGLLHCRQTLYRLNHQGSLYFPKVIQIIKWGGTCTPVYWLVHLLTCLYTPQSHSIINEANSEKKDEGKYNSERVKTEGKRNTWCRSPELALNLVLSFLRAKAKSKTLTHLAFVLEEMKKATF